MLVSIHDSTPGFSRNPIYPSFRGIAVSLLHLFPHYSGGMAKLQALNPKHVMSVISLHALLKEWQFSLLFQADACPRSCTSRLGD